MTSYFRRIDGISKSAFVFTILSCIAGFLIGCTPPAENQLKVALQATGDHLRFAKHIPSVEKTDLYEDYLYECIFDGLYNKVSINEKNGIPKYKGGGGLIKDGIKRADGTYLYRLKRNVPWHFDKFLDRIDYPKSRYVTADDVEFTYDSIIASKNSPYKDRLNRYIEKIHASDDDDFSFEVIYKEEPENSTITCELLTFKILPRYVPAYNKVKFHEMNTQWGDNQKQYFKDYFFGSGPYMVKGGIFEHKCELVRNPHYQFRETDDNGSRNSSKPFFESIVFKIENDAADIVDGFNDGDYDLVIHLPRTEAEHIDREEKRELEFLPLSFLAIAFNCERPETRYRWGLALVIDKSKLLKTLLPNTGIAEL